MTQNQAFFGACTLMKGIVDTVGYGGYTDFIYIFFLTAIYFVRLLFRNKKILLFLIKVPYPPYPDRICDFKYDVK